MPTPDSPARAGAQSGVPAAGSPPAGGALDFLRGGGEMGALVRATDWSATPLGPAASWPQSLRTAVSICLDSGFPVLLWWGPELTMLYNDAYRPILGDKHPRSMGQAGRACWPEIWETIGPMLRDVLEHGRTSYFEDLMLPLERRGFAEECYFTFTYSPIRDESGGVGGVFCAVTETTQRVIGQRQLAVLRDLAAGTAGARTSEQAARTASAALQRYRDDLPFALLYQAEPRRRELRLAASSGLAGAQPAAPGVIAEGGVAPWPVREVARAGGAALLAGLPASLRLAPRAEGAPAPREALVLPVASGGDAAGSGVLVAGLNPRRPLDEGYRGFLELVAGQLAAAFANAHAHEEERRRSDALAEIDRAKTVFFSNVSHEFRTPLTLMIGPTEDALRGGGLSGPQLELVHRNELRLLRLVNALLDFARIEASRLDAVFEPTDLATVTADLASSFRSAAERAGLRLRVDCPALPFPVFVDRDLWEKIVLNLLSNAFKFTFEGEIAVTLRAGERGAELAVSDTGVGIAPDALPRLFERFHRVQAPRARSIEGSGIGLALVKELVAQHGGTITARSAPGEGTTFTVSLPAGDAHLPPERVRGVNAPRRPGVTTRAFVEEVQRWLPMDLGPRGAAEGAPAAAPAPAAGGAGRILVVDDNADMREYVADVLRPRWDVELAPDGLAALEAVRRAAPELVLTDVMMPGLDGFELLRRLRADPATREIPVVILSARTGEEARGDAGQAAADDYLVKPFAARELVARVETHLSLARMRREATRALRTSEAHFREVADFAPVILWVTDADGRCTFLNRRWQELTGQAEADGHGEGWLEVVAAEDVERARDALREAGAAKAPFRVEYRVRRRDGGWAWVIDLAMPRFDGAGTFLGHVGSVVDITDRRRAEEALREADAQKSRFLAVLSHELRNPLAPIRNGIVLLDRAPPGSDAARRAREVLLRQTDHLSRLVDDLLDITRITRGKVELRRERLDAREVVRRACGDVRGVFEQRGLTLALADGEAPLWVDADGARLAQMVGNLLWNALKFTPPGGRVDVALRAAGDRCELTVRDTGIGITAEELERIFEPFEQGARTVSGAPAGMGIGLAVVRELAERQGGTITASSAGPGRGAVFVLGLPLVAAPAPERERAASVSPAAGLSILLVEDNTDAAATLAELLELSGHDVRTVASAREGIAAATAAPPDVLVCDIGLPDQSGHEVARAVRAALGPARPFAIALSGYAQPKDREEALAAGFDAHLAKPPPLRDLEALLARAAGRRTVGAAAAGTSAG